MTSPFILIILMIVVASCGGGGGGSKYVASTAGSSTTESAIPLNLSGGVDLTIEEQDAITSIDIGNLIGSSLLDMTAESEPITYSCYYDVNSVDGIVPLTNLCTSLTGLTFDTSTGVLDWRPDGSAGNSSPSIYEFSIIGTTGSESDRSVFTVTVTDHTGVKIDPVSDVAMSEGGNVYIDAGDGGDDTAGSTLAMTYTCTFNGGTNCSSLPGAVTFNASTGILDWTPDYTAAAIGTFNVTITASDGTLSDDENFVITVADATPTLALDAIGDETVNENVAITTVDAGEGGDDLNAASQAITYTCTYNSGTNCSALPGTVSFAAATGVLDWTPDYTAASVGTFNFAINGSDGSASDDELFIITVNNVNRAPVLDAIGDETVNEGVAIATVNAADGGDDFDVDIEAITYTCTFNSGTNCTSLPGTISFTAATGVLDWTPDYTAAGTGTFNFTITGSDGSLNDTELFTITVNNANQPPVLDAIADETVSENSAITTVNAADGGDDFDADSQAITYTCTFNSGTNCTSLPGTVSFTAATGVLDWTPDYTAAATGTFNFTINGSDGTASDDELFTITVNNTNQLPVLDAISNETVSENVAITTVNAADGSDDFDADSEAITYTCTYNSGTNCTSLPGTVSFTAATGVLDWTPDYTAAATGTFNFTITGSDSYGGDTELFTITVNNANQAPVLDAIGDETVAENVAITTVNAADGADDFDADSQAITYTCTFNSGTNCTSLPGTMSFTAATGVLDWTPDYTAAATGTFNFTINGSDGTASDDELFTITVNNTNQAPVLDAIGDETVAENVAITTVNAADGADDFDADAQAITYTCTFNSGTNCTSLPGTVSFTAATGVLDWTPDYTAAGTGTFNFTINGSDGTASDDELFTITVTNGNQAPVLDAIADETVSENSAITTVNAADGADDFDADAQAITYTCTFNSGTNCTSLPGTVSFTASTGVLDWTPDYTAAATGTFNFTINGSDGTASDDELFTITVNNTNQAPVLDAIGDETVAENAAITTVNAADGADDFDADAQAITYTCTFNSGTNCTSLPGTVSFTAATGVLDWTPDYSAAGTGTFNFTINGSDGTASDDELFTITVTNVNQAPVLDAIGDETVAENVAITTVNAADGADDFDADAQAITYTCTFNGGTNCTSLPGTVSFTAGTGVLDWTPDYTAAATGTFNFTINGSDGTASDDELFTITVTNGNQAPVLDAIGDETVAENSAITTVNAADGADDFDADAQAITYTCTYNSGTNCTSLPGTVSFTAATGVLDWTPDYSAAGTGTFNFTINGSDGTASDDELFTITVTNVNQAPVLDAIGDETVAENVAITTVNAADGADDFDADAQAITYTCTFNSGTNCTSLPGTMSFTAATGVLDWTPDYTAATTGTFNFTINGSDGTASDDELFTITVTNVNQAPVLDAIGDETVAENSAITTVNAADGADDFDADAQAITYTCTYNSGTNCTSLPGTVSFTAATGVLDWTPDNTAAATGTFNFTITGSDGSLNDTELFTITVTNSNQAPVLDAISDETVAENSAITTVNAADGGDDFDADSQAITYTCTYNSGTNCSSLPGTMSFTAATGVLDWTPDYTAAATGTFNFTINGSDGTASDDELFTITVTNVNQAPVLDAIGDETVAENVAITTVNAADGADDFDADAQAITYTCTYNSGTNCTSLPGTMSFTAATGVLDWTPDYTAATTGTFNFTITGSDGSLNDTELFTITVTNSNQAPVLDAIGDETVAENVAITTVNAADGADDFDADAQAITYTCTFNSGTNCTSLPGTVSFTAATGVLDWTPDYTAAGTGTFNFTINGSDGTASDDELFTITVTNVNQAPVLDAIGDETVAENSAITTVNAADGADDFDADAQAITYTCTFNSGTNCTSLPGTVSFTAATGVLDWTPDYTAAATGTFNFTITGSDGSLNDTELFTITVTNSNQAPVLDAIGDETVAENVAITTVNAADGADDFDADVQAITYTCTFNSGTNCTSLPGTVSFTAGTGVLDWTPDYSAATTGTFNFTINGSDGTASDDELFTITVTNVNQAPVLDAIADETVSENSGITTVDAGDNFDDLDGDGQAITYTCTYNSGTNCTSLPGTVSFTAATGVLDWTPDYTAAATGTFNFTINGSDGTASDDELFTITVNNTNRAPVLDAIGDETVSENVAITAVNAADGSDDFDVDNDAITYTCTYNSGTNCTSLPGTVSFTAATGVLNWTPDYTAAATGTFNFTINGSDGTASDDELFTITVNNVNQAPVLDAIGDETVNEGVAITTINAADGADDFDGDAQAITYTCTYNSGTNCTSLPGTVSFTAATGVLDWTPDYTAAATGTFNFTITGSDGSLNDTELFTITVNNANQPPVLDAIGDETVNEGVAITTVNAADGGDDLDAESEAITYTCTFNSGTNCTSLPGTMSFTAATGVLDWTPDFSAAATGTFNFTINGSDGTGSDDELFTITVNNAAAAPVLDAISGESVSELTAITTINAADGGDDFDADSNTITYSCYFDKNAVDGTVASVIGCGTLGATFNTSTGVLDWTPSGTDGDGGVDQYEFRITGTSTGGSDDEIFVVSVSDTFETGFYKVTKGATSGCGLTSEGIAYCWGGNDSGEVGNGTSYSVQSVPNVVTTSLRFTQIEMGAYHTCALAEGGDVYCWGDDSYGQLGNGATGSATTPSLVDMSAHGSDNKFKSIASMQNNHSCGISMAGKVYCWGEGTNRGIGDGGTANRTTPVLTDFSAFSSDLRAVKVITGREFGCALMHDGTVYCWGRNNSYEVGDASGTARSTPVLMSISANLFRDIASFSDGACGITISGGAECWGSGWDGELGDNLASYAYGSTAIIDTTNLAANEVFRKIAGGVSNVCGITNLGNVFCWGTKNQCGAGTGSGTNNRPVAITIGSTVKFIDIAVGQDSAVAVAANGKAYGWGLGTRGQIGDGTTTARYTPVLLNMTNIATTATKLAFHKIDIQSDNSSSASRIGLNSNGNIYELGTTNRVSMAAHSPDSGLMDIDAGKTHNCALSAGGNAYCWGTNANGELGDGSTTPSTTPVLVDMSSFSTDASFIQVSAGTSSSCGLTSKGNAYCWGDNTNGKLGDASTTQRLTPVAVDVSGLTGNKGKFISIDTYGGTTCAVNAEGEAYCWGYNAPGIIGDGTYVSKSIPTLVSTTNMGTDTHIVSAYPSGIYHTCFLSSQGNIYCTGDPDYIGDGTGTGSNTPWPVETSTIGGPYFKELKSGGANSCGLTADGNLYCWGLNAFGQVGDGTSATVKYDPVLFDMSSYGSDNLFYSMSVGDKQICGVTFTGKVYCSGDGLTSPTNSPNEVTQTLP